MCNRHHSFCSEKTGVKAPGHKGSVCHSRLGSGPRLSHAIVPLTACAYCCHGRVSRRGSGAEVTVWEVLSQGAFSGLSDSTIGWIFTFFCDVEIMLWLQTADLSVLAGGWAIAVPHAATWGRPSPLCPIAKLCVYLVCVLPCSARRRLSTLSCCQLREGCLA